MTLQKRNLLWLAIALLIAGAAILLRVYAIDRLPPGLFGDEAVEGLDALDVLAGNFAIWFHAHLGREPIYVYLVALSYRFFGVTPLATRLPALIAGLATIPAAFLFAREWASQVFPRDRATRLALLTTALLAISFWHIQMSRNAHRDTLLPLVEAIGYWLLWRALRTRDWRCYAGAGAVLGLAVYTYSPGRFVGVFIALFVVVEFLIARLTADRRPQPISKAGDGGMMAENSFPRRENSSFILHASSFVRGRRSAVGLGIAALVALIVMLPLGIYFTQNPVQFSRRFASVSVFDFDSPAAAFASSVVGNLAQFVVPGAGYQSKHYNLPGKPVFDLLIAPWFLGGIVIALTRWRQSAYRFMLLWFVVMQIPAFLTADMIPKGVRVLGVVPGVFVFPALAMDWLLDFRFSILDFRFGSTQHATRNTRFVVWGLIFLSLAGSATWTTYDYFVAYANLPQVPLAFDADMTEVAAFVQRQPADQPIYISEEVYRPPTLMLLGERVPTSHYNDRATRFKESDARTALIFGATQPNARYVFVRDYAPPAEWLARVAPNAAQVGKGEYYAAYRLGEFAAPQQAVTVEFNPLLRLFGVSRYDDGIVLYWQVAQLPADRADIQATLTLAEARGAAVAKIAQGKHRFGVPPLEWLVGDVFVEWYALDVPESAAQFSIQLTRGAAVWQSPLLPLR